MTDVEEEVLLFDPTAAQIAPELAAALVEAWADLGTLSKDKRATIPGKEGRAGYEYRYADLADLLELARPVCAKHGLALLQPIERNGSGPVVIETWLLHRSGHFLRWRFEVAASGSPQAIGSAITYGRRYSAQSALGVAADDDDGAAATAAAVKKPAPRKITPARNPREAMNRRVNQLFGQAGLGGDNNRDARLERSSGVIGRTISSSKEMTDEELRAVIEDLEAEQEPPPDTYPEEGY